MRVLITGITGMAGSHLAEYCLSRGDVEVVGTVRWRSPRGGTLSTGTLFGALRRLLEDQWIERFEQEDTTRQKQAYRLTPEGQKQLEQELDRMKRLSRVATARLKTKEA